MAAQEENPFFALVRATASLIAVIFDLLWMVLETISDALFKAKGNRADRGAVRSLAAAYDTAEVYAANASLVAAAGFPDLDGFLDTVGTRYSQELNAEGKRPPAYEVCKALVSAIGALYIDEGLHRPAPLPPKGVDAIEQARYRDRVLARTRKVQDPRTLEIIESALRASMFGFTNLLPPLAIGMTEKDGDIEDDGSHIMVPAIDIIPDVGRAVDELMLPLFAPAIIERGIFSDLRKQIERNIEDLDTATKGKVRVPADHQGPPAQLVRDFLKGTPLEGIFKAKVPFNIADDMRFEHMHVVGGSGHGKTQLLQHLIVGDLRRDQPPALIIIDSQGEMLGKIQKLNLFAPGKDLADRLIIIDPEDTQYPPALNMFDVKTSRAGAHAEQLEATTISLFNYIFSSIAAELTSRQNTTFSYVTRLMLSIDGSSIHTLLQLFEDGAKNVDSSAFFEKIQALDSTSQSYFRNQFFTAAYSPTKQSVARRLYSVLQVPAFERMFASKTNKLDMFDAMQSGKIVLVNTSRLLLQDDASRLFGRYFIALALKAAYDRVTIPDRQRHPAFLIVDEAAEYFDENIEELLNKARKSKLGVLVAHQNLQQKNMTTPLRAAIASCTTIKLAGGVSDSDARALAHDMHTDADFITSMKKQTRSTDFACYVRNYTENAVRLNIPFGTLESAPTMTADEHAAVITRNRQRYAAGRDEPRPAPTGRDTPPTSPPASSDWRS